MGSKILVFGAQGQLGHDVVFQLSSRDYEVIALGRSQLNLEDTTAISQYIHEIKPTVIINCAAYTAVDRAEQEKNLAFQINRDAPEAMAIAAQEINSYLLHISTDYVFDGTNYRPYQTTDIANPLGIYGQSKLAGERAIGNVTDKYLIIRTAWVYGSHGTGNFVKTMLRLGAEREELRVVADQIGSPTWTTDLADSLVQIIPQLSPNLVGIYHYTNSGVCSWYDFAVGVIKQAETLGLPIKTKRINPISTEEYPTPAKRPHYSVLSHQKILPLLNSSPPHWQESLENMLRAYIRQSVDH